MQANIMRRQWLLWIVLLATLVAACGRQSGGAASGTTSTDGSELFETLGCIHCHQMNGQGPGPSLAGVYGTVVPLEGGESVTVDEQYIRMSILDPHAQTHAGYPPIMPSFEDSVNEEQLAALVAYIRSLGE